MNPPLLLLEKIPLSANTAQQLVRKVDAQQWKLESF